MVSRAERMNPATTEKAAVEPSRARLCIGSLAAGTLGAGLALWAIKVDAVNNYHFGVHYAGEEAGQLLVLAALALAIVPMLAAFASEGWDRFLRIVFWTSVAATVVAAINAYGVKQGAAIDATKGAHDRYEQALEDQTQARRDLAEARAEAAAIAETVLAAELQKLYDDARDRRDTEANDPRRGAKCGENCRKAEAEMNVYAPRIAMAHAKESALARADKAQVRLDAAKLDAGAGPKEQSPLAKTLAAWTDTTAENAAEKIALIMAGLMITISVSAGLIFDHAFRVIRKGLGFGQQAEIRSELKLAKAEPGPQPRTARPLPPSIPAEQRIPAFVRETFRAGVELTGAQVYELFAAWWRAHCEGELIPSQAFLSATLVEAGISREKRGGKIRYSATTD